MSEITQIHLYLEDVSLGQKLRDPFLKQLDKLVTEKFGGNVITGFDFKIDTCFLRMTVGAPNVSVFCFFLPHFLQTHTHTHTHTKHQNIGNSNDHVWNHNAVKSVAFLCEITKDTFPFESFVLCQCFCENVQTKSQKKIKINKKRNPIGDSITHKNVAVSLVL